jgi:hypothetical protein
MGWSSIDALVNDVTVNGKFFKSTFNRTVQAGATSAPGRWHECLSGGGTGGAMTLTGTAGAGIVCNSSTVGAIPTGGNVATDIKRLLSMLIGTGGATLAPALVLLTDIIHIYPSCALITTATTLTNHPTWTGTGDTRMTNANGVQASLVVTTTGAGSAAITPTYLDQAGNSQASPRSMQVAVASTPTGSLYGDTGTALTVGGPFMPLAAGDTGVQRIASYAINTGMTAGVGSFILHRPIAQIPIGVANLFSERDFLAGIPTLPRIYDDACLGLFIQIGGAATAGQTIVGELNFGWGA